MAKNHIKAISAFAMAICLLTSCQFKDDKKEKEAKEKAKKDEIVATVLDNVKGEIKDPPPPIINITKEPEIITSELPKVIAGEPIPDPRPHHYKILFTWNNKENFKTEIEVPAEGPSKPVESSITEGNKTLFKGTSVEGLWFVYDNPGKKHFKVSYYKGTGGKLDSHPLTVEIPEDIVLTGRAVLTQKQNQIGSYNLKIARVFFDSTYQLFLNGNSFNIYTKDLYVSDKAQIRNFENPHSEGNGRGGGYVYIEANKAEGTLNIDLRGQNGADGSGAPPIPEAAADGANGISGAGLDEEVNCIERCYKMPAKCTRQPTNGLPGANGANGNVGRDGFRGGDGGNISIKVSENTLDEEGKLKKFIVRYNVQGGMGGKGGQGSAGQQAGRGGVAGPQGHPTCTPAVNGADGINGQRGNDGKSGQPGLNGEAKTDSERVQFIN